MADDQQTPVSDIIANVNGAEERLQELISHTSIDFLGASTRAFMDKAVLASAVGILLSTIGKIKSEAPLGPFVFLLNAPSIIYGSIIFVILFYASALFFLAKIDFMRWRSIYDLRITSIKIVTEQLNRIADEFGEIGKNKLLDLERRYNAGEYSGAPTDSRGIPLPLVIGAQEVQTSIQTVSNLIQKIAKSPSKVRRQARNQIIVFVILPLIFSLISIVLCFFAITRNNNPLV